MFLAIIILTALLYSVAERKTRESFTITKRGGLTFIRCGRVSGSFSLRRVA